MKGGKRGRSPAEPLCSDLELEEESHDALAHPETSANGVPAEQTGKGTKCQIGGDNGKKGGKRGRGGKDAGKGKTKGKGAAEKGHAAWKEGQQRVNEPAPSAKAAGGAQRADRRKLRAQLQAKR